MWDESEDVKNVRYQNTWPTTDAGWSEYYFQKQVENMKNSVHYTAYESNTTPNSGGIYYSMPCNNEPDGIITAIFMVVFFIPIFAFVSMFFVCAMLDAKLNTYFLFVFAMWLLYSFMYLRNWMAERFG